MVFAGSRLHQIWCDAAFQFFSGKSQYLDCFETASMAAQNLDRSPGNSQGVSQQLNQLSVCPVLEGRRGQAYFESLIPAADDRFLAASGLNPDSKAGLSVSLKDREHPLSTCLLPCPCPSIVWRLFWLGTLLALSDPLRRASLSVCLNNAEGAGEP